jgi:mono/diheme cytochrome c family protein
MRLIGFLMLSGLLAVAVTSATEPARSVWDGLFTEEQAKRGETLYMSSCAYCHGLDLRGGETPPPLAEGQFRANWDGLSVGDLFERIRITMPQDRPGTLTRQQVADVLAFIFSKNEFPAGKTELPTQTDILKQYAFKATKP